MDNCSKSQLTKIARKQKRCQHIIEREIGIKCSPSPTKHLVICNAGIANGLSEEVVYENFVKYGSVENISMLPGKSTCVVTYHELNSSVTAYENINGRLYIGQYKKPIYLLYIKSIPEIPKDDLHKKPPGLIVIDNFVSESEEDTLLELYNFDNSDTSTLKHRQVKHYGYEFRYDINNVDNDSPLDEDIPTECDFLWERLKSKDVHCSNFKPDQLTLNHYKPGQGIPGHIDTHSAFEDPIMSLSLGSAVVMQFKKGDLCLSVCLPQRSLTIISGECRYDWTHAIVPKKVDFIPLNGDLIVSYRRTRVSFTFRKLRKGECDCSYTDKCDSYSKKLENKTIENDVASKLEDLHVHQVYETIASHFSDTRHKPWPNVVKFLQSLEKGSILIDVGCGNGKYLDYNDLLNVGCDTSFGLLDVCRTKGFEVFSCNCLNLPIRDNIADGVISIAVIHHLANKERRLRAVSEMVRVLKVGGKGLIYVWAKDQNKNQEKTSYLKQDRKNRKKHANIVDDKPLENVIIGNDVSLPIHTNRKQFQHKDLLVPWKLKNENESNSGNSFLRFYHVFEEGELEDLCSRVDTEIISSYYDEGNWCCVFEKIR